MQNVLVLVTAVLQAPKARRRLEWTFTGRDILEFRNQSSICSEKNLIKFYYIFLKTDTYQTVVAGSKMSKYSLVW